MKQCINCKFYHPREYVLVNENADKECHGFCNNYEWKEEFPDMYRNDPMPLPIRNNEIFFGKFKCIKFEKK